ncbi:MAG: sugar phosphate isomerase/epimerase family protein, partial [Verrucomicrobiia bacterium]
MKQFDRRQFLKSSAGLAALGSIPFPHIAAKPGPLSGEIKIAVKYHMIAEPDLSVVEKFRMLKEIGFDGVELKTDDPTDANEFVRAIEQTGLPVHGVINSSNPDIISAVNLAKRLGGDSVLVLAKESGIYLCMENVRATFLKTGEGMARFIDSFDSPFVRSYYDIGNTITWTEQSAEHWAKALGSRIYKLDIKDRGHREFGDAKQKRKGITTGTDGGEVNWVKVREELNRVSFSGWATAEVAGGDRKRLTG